MSLLKFDLIEGRSDQQLRVLLDAVHRAVLEAFDVPQRDRCQVVTEHKGAQLVIEDTGLDFKRTSNLVAITVTTTPRSENAKQAFYAAATRLLKADCNIEPTDVMVSIVTNTKADWSFGEGVAQNLTEAL